jgi:hypothetical protein
MTRTPIITNSVPLTGEDSPAVQTAPQLRAAVGVFNSALVSAMTAESATAPDFTDPPVAVAATNSIDPGPCGFDFNIIPDIAE